MPRARSSWYVLLLACGAENVTYEALTDGAEDLVARIQVFRKLSSAVGSSALDSLNCLSATSTELRLRESRLKKTTEEQAQVRAVATLHSIQSWIDCSTGVDEIGRYMLQITHMSTSYSEHKLQNVSMAVCQL